MIGWLQNLDENARSVSLSQASLNSGITPKAIEKDWWVTLVLRMLFTSKYAPYFAFKGGTSLSKGWGIIDRFSEDIDIALNSVAFGMPYLIYSNNGTHDLFQASQDMVVIQYFKLYNVENEDISNQIQLIDERKIHTGIFSENNLELNYYIESCY